MAAYELARAGRRVALIEKKALPRHKVCAGGLTARVLRLLPFDVSPVIDASVNTLRLTLRHRPQWSFQRSYPEPFAHMVMRYRFDGFLVEKAHAAGADVSDGVAVEGVREEGKWVVVQAAGAELAARAVVGADGALSTVARSVGLMRDASKIGAVEAEVEVPAQLLGAYRSSVALELNGHGGYGWVFPKRQHLSVGLEVANRSQGARAELMAYLSRMGLDGLAEKTQGYILRFRRPGSPIARGRVLLVGEAAGLVDVFTGEGIYYALWSGRLAGQWLARALGHEDIDSQGYQAMIDRELMSELKHGRVFFYLYRLWPTLFFLAMRWSDRFWQAFCRLQLGELTYGAVRKRLEAFEPLFRLVERF